MMMATTTTKSMNMIIMPIMIMTMMVETINSSNRTGKEGVYESMWFGTYTL